MSKHLVPYLTAGFPKLEWFEDLVKALDNNGADFIEIGVPFSDPIADGPTIQNSSQVALDNGASVQWILDEVARFRADIRAELIFFTYYNPLTAIADDLDGVAQKLKDLGFHGVLVPDLSLEQAKPLIEALQKVGMHYIPLIAPTTPEKRLEFIAPYTTSFAYGVSVTGVTGARAGVSSGLDEYLARVRRHLNQFVVGFGISTPEDAAKISKVADGVVVGSALIRKLEGTTTREEAVKAAGDFIGSLRAAIDAT
ncbi:MAG: tryptophan synthase subunit alpha [Acidobacteriota bacterium]|nr:tryptophan synthase subunit alpha [Acidobacteriota bacterium]